MSERRPNEEGRAVPDDAGATVVRRIGWARIAKLAALGTLILFAIVVARGVRLRGRLVNGRVSWGQIDKLLPPPTKQPFKLPDIVLDVADSSIALLTPFGPVGIAAEGSGRLSGGFKGHVALASPRIVPGKCAAMNLRANLA